MPVEQGRHQPEALCKSDLNTASAMHACLFRQQGSAKTYLPTARHAVVVVNATLVVIATARMLLCTFVPRMQAAEPVNIAL